LVEKIMSEGRIQKALSGFYYVDTGSEVLTCRARGKFRKEGVSPLVGDRVEVRELGNGEGVVDKILPRRNFFARPAVANIDQLVVIASASIPKTDPFLIDRVASIAALKDCEVIVVLNKCDLDPADDLYGIYQAAGFRTLRVSAETGEGLEELKTVISGKLSAFTGNSGVGKSSILNALDPEFQLKVGEVSDALGRGRHTTRHVELFTLSCGAEIMDTPGFSSFETDELNLELKHRLPETFRDFVPYLDDCRFVGCSHTKEKGCAVLDALKHGKIQKSRHESYLRLHEELKPLKEWQENKK
jgi:ribosome biogenesis GTPase